MYHSFFIRSPVDGHLGCFHVLAIVNSAIVNSAAMNTGLRVCLHYYLSQPSCCTLDPHSFWVFTLKSVLLDQSPPKGSTAQCMATTLESHCLDLTHK